QTLQTGPLHPTTSSPPTASRRAPSPHPLEPAGDARPGLEARGIEAVGRRQLDGEAHAARNRERLLVELAAGGPRHEAEATPSHHGGAMNRTGNCSTAPGCRWRPGHGG